MLCVSCRDGGKATIVLECQSPDKQMNAVFWDWMGGGAAGWAYEYVSVIPANRRAADVLKTESINDGMVLQFGHASDLILTWQDNHTLTVEYPDSAVVHYAAPGEVYAPLTPTLKVIHRGISPASAEGTLVGGNQCKSSQRANN